MDIDIVETAREWPVLSDRLARETDERKRAMISQLVLHMVGEYIGDTPMVMETLVDEPDYYYWGLAPGPAPRNRAEVIANYDFSATVMQNMTIERMIVDDDLIFTEGHLLLAVEKERAAELAGSEAAKGLDPSTKHVVSIRLGIVWPYAPDARLLGENIYFGSKAEVIRPLEPGEKLYTGPVERVPG